MVRNKLIRPFSLSDAQQLATDNVVTIANDLLVVDDLGKVNLSDEALQLGFVVFCLCTSGEASFKLNAKTVRITPGSLFLSVGSQVFIRETVSDDFRARMVLVSRQCMQDGIAGLHQLWPYLLHMYENPVIRLRGEEYQWVNRCFDYMQMRLRMQEHHYLRESVAALIRLFYFDVCDLLFRHCPRPTQARSGAYAVFDRFIRLLDENYKVERNVAWYSEQICITPKYLSEVAKLVSGKTAGQWITDFVIIEIKQLLNNTSLSIKEIAREMNFSSQSFLGKYFKKSTGCSPLDYRRRDSE